MNKKMGRCTLGVAIALLMTVTLIAGSKGTLCLSEEDLANTVGCWCGNGFSRTFFCFDAFQACEQRWKSGPGGEWVYDGCVNPSWKQQCNSEPGHIALPAAGPWEINDYSCEGTRSVGSCYANMIMMCVSGAGQPSGCPGSKGIAEEC